MDLDNVEQWKSTLVTILAGFGLKELFNMDEIGFFRVLWDSTLSHASQLCMGGKQVKDRVLEGFDLCKGWKLSPCVIEKSKITFLFCGVDLKKA